MKRNIIQIALLLLFTVNTFSQNKQVILNLNDAKKSVKDYYKSGQYDIELEKCINEALLNLEQIEIPENAAFVFDVDETALSNWSYEINYDFGFIKRHWDEWVDSSKAPVIPQVKRFYDSLVAKNVKIIFITGRKHNQYEGTLKNLKDVGYNKVDTLICKPVEYFDKKAVEYKSNTRKALSSKYKIIGSIGDQWSDLEGGWTILKVKLPNYMYFIE